MTGPAQGRPARATRVPPRRRPQRRGQLRLARQGRRQRVALASVFLALSVLAGRLVQLQSLDAPAYAEAAVEQRARARVLPAPRGAILDRNGAPLAYTVEARAITADNRFVDDPEGTAKALASVLDRPEADLRAGLSDATRAFTYLARQVDPETARRVLDLDLPGVYTEREPERVYPNGDLAANLMGFTSSTEFHGLAGVEGAMNDALTGIDGRRTMEVDREGRQIPTAESTEVPAVPGDDVVLTIDRDLQWAAQDALNRQVAATGAEGGQVIIMDARSGEVLALAANPTFDPADPGASAAEDRGNPALSEVFEPGSTNKVITAAAALQEGVVTPDSPVTVTPTLRVADKAFSDSTDRARTEVFTFAGVIAESSNVGTIDVALRMSPETLHRYMRAFGYGERSGVGLPGESPGILRPPQDWTGSSRGTIPIGQGVSTTSLQVASVYQTVANGGVRVAPSLIKGVRDPGGRLRPAAPAESRRVVDAETANQLVPMLEAVTTDDGTAPRARVPGYRVAGKTGTANRVVDGRYSGYVASFAGFAPADDPRLVIEVVLDNPKTSIYGGTTAAPVFAELMTFALTQQGVPPTGTAAADVRLRVE